MRASGVFKIKHDRSRATLDYGKEVASLESRQRRRKQIPEHQQVSQNEKKRVTLLIEYLRIQGFRQLIQRDIRNVREQKRKRQSKPFCLNDKVSLLDIWDPASFLAEMLTLLAAREQDVCQSVRQLDAKIARKKENVRRQTRR